MVLGQPHRHRHFFQVHSDERTADVQSGIRTNFLQCRRMPERLIGGGRKGAARLGLWHHIDDLRAGNGLPLHDQRPVQVLAALGGHVNAHGGEYAVKPPENGVGSLRCGPASHLMPHHLAGAASDHYDLSLMQSGRLRQLPGRSGRLLPNLLQKSGIL